MIKPINLAQESELFNRLSTHTHLPNYQNLKNIGLEQKDLLIRTIAENMDTSRPELIEAFKTTLELLSENFKKQLPV